MQIAQDNAAASASLGAALPDAAGAARSRYSDYKVIRRNGAVVGFEPAKVSVAMTKAFLAVNGSQGAASARIRLAPACHLAGRGRFSPRPYASERRP